MNKLNCSALVEDDAADVVDDAEGGVDVGPIVVALGTAVLDTHRLGRILIGHLCQYIPNKGMHATTYFAYLWLALWFCPVTSILSRPASLLETTASVSMILLWESSSD